MNCLEPMSQAKSGSREKFKIMKGHAPGLEEGQAKPQAPQFYRQILVSDEFDTQS